MWSALAVSFTAQRINSRRGAGSSGQPWSGTWPRSARPFYIPGPSESSRMGKEEAERGGGKN